MCKNAFVCQLHEINFLCVACALFEWSQIRNPLKYFVNRRKFVCYYSIFVFGLEFEFRFLFAVNPVSMFRSGNKTFHLQLDFLIYYFLRFSKIAIWRDWNFRNCLLYIYELLQEATNHNDLGLRYLLIPYSNPVQNHCLNSNLEFTHLWFVSLAFIKHYIRINLSWNVSL